MDERAGRVGARAWIGCGSVGGERGEGGDGERRVRGVRARGGTSDAGDGGARGGGAGGAEHGAVFGMCQVFCAPLGWIAAALERFEDVRGGDGDEGSDESAATRAEAASVDGSATASASGAASRATVAAAGRDHTWRGKGMERPRISSASAAAAFLGHLASVSHLDAAVASSPPFDFVNAVDAHMSSPMMWAAGAGNLDVVKRLAALNVETATLTRRKDRREPIHWAARNGRLETIEWLCANTPASPRAMTRDGDYPFHYAVWKMHFRCAEWLAANAPETALSTNRFGCNALLWVCSSDADENVVLSMVRWLVEIKGVPFDVVNVHGHSAVHKCAIYGHGKVIEYLLSPTRCDEELRRRLTQPDDQNEELSVLARLNGFDALAERLEHELKN